MKILPAEINGWREFKGDDLPASAMPFLEKANERNRCNWLAAAYKGDTPETSKEWMLVTDDGWYYKVRAKYCVWFSDGRMFCAWSQKFARKLVQCHAAGTYAGVDPQYHT